MTLSFINIRKVPREVLTSGEHDFPFMTFARALRMLMNDKIMFDRYYCINSTKQCKLMKILVHYIL